MLQILKTKDNSPTLYVPELDETYHSRNGALEESEYVFIQKGLFAILDSISPVHTKPLQVLEVGLGTGLNALLTLREAETKMVHIHYHAVETVPLEISLIQELHMDILPNVGSTEIISAIHAAPWNQPIALSPYFSLTKHLMPLQDFESDHTFDLIYFDAFGPDKQPELWTEQIFAKLYQMSSLHGILVTYSAKGQVRRNMKAAGFEVERLPGPPMKRHMTRATKK